jgi:ribulose-phosphate 3-epimerase
MIEHPEKYIPAFAEAGAWNITIHREACASPKKVLSLIKKQGCRAGISLRPRTPLTAIAPYLDDVDLVLVMTVEPGFGGQKFMPDMMEKVRWLRDQNARRKKKFWIEVDGGINADTATTAAQAGADAFVAGNAIFAAPDPARALRALRRLVSTPAL